MTGTRRRFSGERGLSRPEILAAAKAIARL